MVIVRIRRGDGTTDRLTFDKPEIAVGRDAALNDIVIAEGSVSKNHALIARTSAGVLLTDLNSTNGTHVNGEIIASSTAIALRQGDEIMIGSARIWIDPETLTAPRRVYDPDGAVEQPPRRRSAGPPDTELARGIPALVRGPAGPGPQIYEMPATVAPVVEQPVISQPPPSPPKPSRSSPSDREREAFSTGLVALVDRIVKAINVEAFTKATKPPADAIKKLDEVIAAQLRAMPDVSEPLTSQLAAAARREFVETGPIGAWLDDAEITQIQCLRYNSIELTLQSGKVIPADQTFSSGAALHRAMIRLAKQSGKEWTKGELIVERRIQNGSRLVALVPPMAASLSLTIRKREPISRTMDELVAARALSDRMAAFLTRCLRSKLNIVICGNVERSVLELTSALASVTPPNSRIAVLHTGGDIRVENRRTMSFGLPVAPDETEKALRTAVLLGFEHTFAMSPIAGAAAATVTAITGGGSGIVLGLRARSLPKGLAITAGELMLGRPGLTQHAASLIVASAFEIGLEVNTVPDGRSCVVRIAEIEPSGSGQGLQLRDLFVLTNAEDGKEAVFAATGATARALVD